MILGIIIIGKFDVIIKASSYIFGSGVLSGKMLLVRIVENNIIMLI